MHSADHSNIRQTFFFTCWVKDLLTINFPELKLKHFSKTTVITTFFRMKLHARSSKALNGKWLIFVIYFFAKLMNLLLVIYYWKFFSKKIYEYQYVIKDWSCWLPWCFVGKTLFRVKFVLFKHFLTFNILNQTKKTFWCQASTNWEDGSRVDKDKTLIRFTLQ